MLRLRPQPHLPRELHRVFRHEVSSPHVYKSMVAEVERSNATSEALARLLATASAAQPLLGALPLLVVRATEFSVLAPDALAAWRRLVAADASTSLLSTRTAAHTLDGAGHMFFDDKSAVRMEQLVVEFATSVL